MALELENFGDEQLSGEYVSYLLDKQSPAANRHYERFWDYFRNPIMPAAGLVGENFNANSRPYYQAQEFGLPPRITGVQRCKMVGQATTDLTRKEVVIENDIAWRIHAMVDFLFGQPVRIRSLAGDGRLAMDIETIVNHVIAANGGQAFLQELAMLGGVYGFADVVMRIPSFDESSMALADEDSSQVDEFGGTLQMDRSSNYLAAALQAAEKIMLETVDATRVLPILDENDYRRIRYWMQRYVKHTSGMSNDASPWLPWRRRGATPTNVEVVEIIGEHWWQRYHDRMLVDEGPNVLGFVPVAHVQNYAMPGVYEGISDVEQLIPLQDELNTRLSDRAHRVTYQSFKMYLGKGIDDFLERPVGPGQMWATQNMQANIEEFGSDNGSPSEDAHIAQVRAAMDKVSGVSPLAAGLIQGNVGYLTSATALRVLLSGLLARTNRKRLTYGAAIERVAGFIMDWLDMRGIFRTSPMDRRFEIEWPDPLPGDGAAARGEKKPAALATDDASSVESELGYIPGNID